VKKKINNPLAGKKTKKKTITLLQAKKRQKQISDASLHSFGPDIRSAPKAQALSKFMIVVPQRSITFKYYTLQGCNN
jgi:hypothetical protein